MNAYEPFHIYYDDAPAGFVPTWAWFRGFGLAGSDLPEALFARLTGGRMLDGEGGYVRDYLTRGEALQDLAQAMQGAA